MVDKSGTLYVMNVRKYNQGYYECVGETKENEDF